MWAKIFQDRKEDNTNNDRPENQKNWSKCGKMSEVVTNYCWLATEDCKRTEHEYRNCKTDSSDLRSGQEI